MRGLASSLLLAALTEMIANGAVISSDGVTDRGEWGRWEFCPHGHLVTSMQLKVEGDQGARVGLEFKDDTALNGVKLLCKPVSHLGSANYEIEMTSSVGRRGFWGSKQYCPPGTLVTGFRLRTEPFQGTGWWDDTAANDLYLGCSDGSEVYGDGLSRGSWQSWQQCPAGMAVCGIQTQVDRPKGYRRRLLRSAHGGHWDQGHWPFSHNESPFKGWPFEGSFDSHETQTQVPQSQNTFEQQIREYALCRNGKTGTLEFGEFVTIENGYGFEHRQNCDETGLNNVKMLCCPYKDNTKDQQTTVSSTTSGTTENNAENSMETSPGFTTEEFPLESTSLSTEGPTFPSTLETDATTTEEYRQTSTSTALENEQEDAAIRPVGTSVNDVLQLEYAEPHNSSVDHDNASISSFEPIREVVLGMEEGEKMNTTGESAAQDPVEFVGIENDTDNRSGFLANLQGQPQNRSSSVAEPSPEVVELLSNTTVNVTNETSDVTGSEMLNGTLRNEKTNKINGTESAVSQESNQTTPGLAPVNATSPLPVDTMEISGEKSALGRLMELLEQLVAAYKEG